MSAPVPGPYDLAPPTERDYFARFGPGVVIILPARRPGPTEWGRGGPPHGGAWIHVGEDGTTRAFTGKVEVGQGTRTALTLLVAEELGMPLGAVDLTMGDTDVSPCDMGTFGSRSMPDAGENLRTTAAAAREVVLEIAATTLGVPKADLAIADGRIRTGTGSSARSVGIGDLVRGLHRIETITAPAQLSQPSGWTRAGHPTANLGGREIVTGTRQYTSDLRPAGMLHGRVLFAPQYGAKLRSVDLSRAAAMPGVTVVHEGDFVGVASPDFLTTRAALKAIRAEWDTTPQPSEGGIVEFLRQHPAEGEDSWDLIHHVAGDVDAALAAAPVTLHETYTTAYIAHVPMETHAVLAAWEAGRLTVWMGSQTPFRARDALSDAFGIPESSVRVVVPATGSGFGGKHAAELAVRAARLAKAAGRPVCTVYTREEEFTQAYFRPMAVIDVQSGAEKDGTITAWRFNDLNAGSAAARLPYKVTNQQIQNQPAESPLPQGSYRALAATANNFARESHMDELAARVGVDPVEYRLRHLGDDRLAAVLRAVVHRAEWTPHAGTRARNPGPVRGWGVAVGLEKGGRVATVAEVSVHEDRRLEILRLVTGFECGTIVHPSNLRNQVEGGTIMALGGALFEAIHFENGRILNPRLSEYRVPRFRDVPRIDIVLVDRPDLPSEGAGETPLIAVAPAIANAIYDATGRRLRSLPLVPDGTVP